MDHANIGSDALPRIGSSLGHLGKQINALFVEAIGGI